MERVGLEPIRAVQNGRVHGLWHSGYGIVNLELIATWLHPEHFRDIDPAMTQEEMDRRFMPTRQRGTFWTSLSMTEN